MDEHPTLELALSDGQSLDQYIIDEELGPKRLGTPIHVYRAHHRATQAAVALKVLSLKFDRDHATQRALERFIREARVMRQLCHPNILQVLAVNWDQHNYWIVMPYLAKGSLADFMQARQHQPLPIEQACTFGIQIAQALTCAHSQIPPILHRDINPRNLLLGDDCQLQLMDFGIAHVLHEPHFTQFDKALGTPEYMAPEQLRMRDDSGPERIDPRVDIYALGCVLYELLSGYPPFMGSSSLAVSLAQLRAEPQPLSAKNPQVNLGLQLIVHRALAKNPAERYASAEEFRQVLARYVTRE